MVEKINFNILKHKLVPEHTIMNEEEKKALLEKHNILIDQLPKILAMDAAVKALEATEGDVLRIVRSSPTAGKTTYYRLVKKIG